MSANVAMVLDRLIIREGGYVNNPRDKGGPTNWGITAATVGRWRNMGGDATSIDVQALTSSEARAIYARDYIEAFGFHLIADFRVMDITVDTAVLFGPGRAIEFLGLSCGFSGTFDAAAIAKVNRCDARDTVERMVASRLYRHAKIITEDPSQAGFAKQWIKRAYKFLPTQGGGA